MTDSDDRDRDGDDLPVLYEKVRAAADRVRALRQEAQAERLELDRLRDVYAARQFRINEGRFAESAAWNLPLPPNSAARKRRHAATPNFLLSYPKSGRTWLAYLYVFYAAHRLLGSRAEVFLTRHFANVPLEPTETLAFAELQREPGAARLVPHVAFEHLPHTEPYTRMNLRAMVARIGDSSRAAADAAVLLVRDPRDVLVSHYHHLRWLGQTRLDPDVDLAEFARSEIWGIRAIVTCMNQMIDAWPSRFARFGVLHFEDMCADPGGVLARFLDLIGASEIAPDAIRAAAAAATFDRLQGLERSRRAVTGEPVHRDALRFRRGTIGSCRDELAASDLAYLDSVIARMLAVPFDRYRPPAAIARESRGPQDGPIGSARAPRKVIKQELLRQAEQIFERVRTLKGPAQEHASLRESERARARAQQVFGGIGDVIETNDLLEGIARSGRRVIVGPWLLEPGFELLYWIPFLNWAVTQFDLAPERLIAVSRGGAAPWYRHLTAQYQDVFDFWSAEEFVSRSSRLVELSGGRKPMTITEVDQDVIDRVRRTAGVSDAAILHPSVMFKLFRLFWKGYAPIGLVQGHTVHRRVSSPDPGELAKHLPAEYVAVKFYGRASFPDTPANQAFVDQCLAQLAETHHVVLLHSGIRFDQHHELRADRHDRIHSIAPWVTPRNNLELQTQVIAHARAFVGTYGGFSYLAPLCGVDALSFFSDPAGFRPDHLDVATRAFAELGQAAMIPLDVRKLGVLRMGLGSRETPVTAGRS